LALHLSLLQKGSYGACPTIQRGEGNILIFAIVDECNRRPGRMIFGMPAYNIDKRRQSSSLRNLRIKSVRFQGVLLKKEMYDFCLTIAVELRCLSLFLCWVERAIRASHAAQIENVCLFECSSLTLRSLLV
jgi:hypothetical protein